MPKTSIEKDGNPFGGKNNVGIPVHGIMFFPSADSAGNEDGAETALGRPISGRADFFHYFRAFFRAKSIQNGQNLQKYGYFRFALLKEVQFELPNSTLFRIRVVFLCKLTPFIRASIRTEVTSCLLPLNAFHKTCRKWTSLSFHGSGAGLLLGSGLVLGNR